MPFLARVAILGILLCAAMQLDAFFQGVSFLNFATNRHQEQYTLQVSDKFCSQHKDSKRLTCPTIVCSSTGDVSLDIGVVVGTESVVKNIGEELKEIPGTGTAMHEGESSMEDAGSGQQNPKIINKHKSFPHTLFRLLNSRTPSMKARPKTDGPGSFDMVIESGMVHPLETDEFLGPNGASFRPNTFEEYYLVSGRSTKSFICEVPAGTEVPPGCVLVHEFGDHFSLQPAEVMTVEQFNTIVTQFLQGFRVYKRDEWLRAHPLGSQLVLK